MQNNNIKRKAGRPAGAKNKKNNLASLDSSDSRIKNSASPSEGDNLIEDIEETEIQDEIFKLIDMRMETFYKNQLKPKITKKIQKNITSLNTNNKSLRRSSLDLNNEHKAIEKDNTPLSYSFRRF